MQWRRWRDILRQSVRLPASSNWKSLVADGWKAGKANKKRWRQIFTTVSDGWWHATIIFVLPFRVHLFRAAVIARTLANSCYDVPRCITIKLKSGPVWLHFRSRLCEQLASWEFKPRLLDRLDRLIIGTSTIHICYCSSFSPCTNCSSKKSNQEYNSNTNNTILKNKKPSKHRFI